MKKLLAFALLLELGACFVVEGFPLADAIGYVERARVLVFEGSWNPSLQSMRSMVFSLLFAPLFYVGKLLGTEDFRFVIPVARGLQVGISLGFVFASVRLVDRLRRYVGPFTKAGESPGPSISGFGEDPDRVSKSALLAGYLVACNPFFLTYCTVPVADIAAGLCAAMGVERVLDGRNPKRARWGAAWCGLAFLVSYKTLVLFLLLCVLLCLGEFIAWGNRWRSKRRKVAGEQLASSSLEASDGASLPSRRTGFGVSLRIGLGLLVATTVQFPLDYWVYGRWGHSVLSYLIDNIFGVTTRLFFAIGLDGVGRSVYRVMADLRGFELAPELHGHVEPAAQMPPSFYLTEFPSFLVPPVLLLLAIGLWSLFSRPRWSRVWVLLLCVGYFLILSSKGSKSFRLALPLLPYLGFLLADGWAFARERWVDGLTERVRAVLVPMGLFLVFGFGWLGFLGGEPRAFGAYIQAMDYLNARSDAASEGIEEFKPWKVATAHNFATFLRAGPSLEPLRYNVAPWNWKDDQSQMSSRRINGMIRNTLLEADWLLHAEKILAQKPLLMKGVDHMYTVEAAFYDEGAHSPRVGPVYVLKKRPEGSDTAEGRGFMTFRRDTPPDQWVEEYGLTGEPVRFLNPLAELPGGREFEAEEGTIGVPREELWLLGFQYELLPGSGMGWITFYWYTPTGLSEDYRFDMRIRSSEEAGGSGFINLSHWPAYNTVRTSRWLSGMLVRSSYPVRRARWDFGDFAGPWKLSAAAGNDASLEELGTPLADLSVSVIRVDEEGQLLEVLAARGPQDERLDEHWDDLPDYIFSTVGQFYSSDL